MEDGTVYSWGMGNAGRLGLGDEIDRLNPEQVTFFADKIVTEIELGKIYGTAILENGEIYVWGKNGSGELGLGHKLTKESPQKVSIHN